MFELVLSNSETSHAFVLFEGTQDECETHKIEVENLAAYSSFDTFTVQEKAA